MSFSSLFSIIKRFGLVAAIPALFAGIFLKHWYKDFLYSGPVQTPVGLEQPPLGSAIKIPDLLVEHIKTQRPTLLHFVDPLCPCADFNLSHLKDLMSRYGDTVQFVAVLQSREIERARKKFESFKLDIPYVIDFDAAVTSAYGVYSSPQAVILDWNNKLHYRGNYAPTRHRATAQTEYARIALQALSDRVQPEIDEKAFLPWGCKLPGAMPRLPASETSAQ